MELIPVDKQSVANIIQAIKIEVARQETIWGVQNHSPDYWVGILTEEVGEVARAVIERDSVEKICEELIQTAAVCVSFAEFMKTRYKGNGKV